MKILFAIKTLDTAKGGAEKVLSEISSGLAENGHQVSVLSFDKPHGKSFYNFSQKVRRIRLSVGNVLRKATFWEVITRMRIIRKIVTRHKPDIIIAFMHSSFIPCAFALIGTGVPVIASEHTVPKHYKGSRYWEFILLILSRFFVKKITVLSETVKNEYPKSLHKKMIVLNNPVKPATKLANTSGDNCNQKTLLCVGRLVKSKRQILLIESFAKIANENPDWVLKIAGEGYLKPQIEHAIEEHGLENRVILIGATRDIYKEYEQAQLFVQPSNYESFGLVTAEAMAHALPVIGFKDCAGTNEIIKNNVNGILVDPKNDRVAELAKTLNKLMQDTEMRIKLGSDGPNTIKKFKEEIVINQWKELVMQIVKNK